MNTRQGRLSQKEFNERCYEVFEPLDGDEFYLIEINSRGDVEIRMTEKDEDGGHTLFIFIPDMTSRPHALAYLLGECDDFDD